MPRKRPTGTNGLYYIKSRKLYRAVADDGFWPDGRRKQISVMSKTRAEAEAKLLAKLAETEEFGAPLDKRTTVATWSTTWLETVCRPHMTPNGLKAYESITRKWIVPTIGTKVVATIKPSDVRLVVKAISDAGLSSSTGLKAYNILSKMLESARADGMSKKNVAKDVIKPKAAVSEVGALTAEQALAILRTAQTEVDGTRWWVAILSGLRQGERLGAQIADLDLDAGLLTVSWALTEVTSEHGCGGTCGKTRGASCPSARLKLPDGFVYRQLAGRLVLKRPKSGKVRTVPIPLILVGMFRDYLAATAHLPNPHGLIWRNADGSPIIGKQDEQDWRDLLVRAGQITGQQALPPREREDGITDPPGAHTARHTTATVLMELGVDAKIIGEIVGHQSAKTTRGYQHVSTAAATDAAQRIGDHFTNALGA